VSRIDFFALYLTVKGMKPENLPTLAMKKLNVLLPNKEKQKTLDNRFKCLTSRFLECREKPSALLPYYTLT